LAFPHTELPNILATRGDVLSPRMVHVIEELAGDWHRLDERIEGLSTEIKALADQDPACKRLMSVPGIGPIISSAMVAAIGNGAAFSKGRDFGAWLGLVPRQMSTGDRTILGKISKQGNRYLRVLFVQAAWVVLVKSKTPDLARAQAGTAHPLGLGQVSAAACERREAMPEGQPRHGVVTVANILAEQHPKRPATSIKPPSSSSIEATALRRSVTRDFVGFPIL
jgi:transposase